MLPFQRVLSIVASLLLSIQVFSQQPLLPDSISVFGLLQQFDPLEVTIVTDIKGLKTEKAGETWQPGVFKVMRGDSVALSLPVQVSARGNMRKKTCDFPPVKVRFYETEPENDSLADINELKLVTSCKYAPQNEEWVRQECLIYELYNILTEESFRVKHAAIRFEDPERRNRSMESFSFFIESEKELASRLNGNPIKPRIGSIRSLDSVSYDRMALFQYMIGNTDWGVRSRHNIKLIFLHKTARIVPVPYDFDYAGAVGTDYAVPNGDYPIRSVQERYYLGSCRSPEHYRQIFDLFLAKEKSLLRYCEKSLYVSQGARNSMSGYFRSFFDVLKDPQLTKREITWNCGKGK